MWIDNTRKNDCQSRSSGHNDCEYDGTKFGDSIIDEKLKTSLKNHKYYFK